MNTELSKIEKTFLAKRNIKSALNLTAIKSAIDEDLKIGAKKFDGSIALSAHVVTAYEWYKSADGKDAMVKAKIEWNIDAFSLKVFGWGKSYMHKMRKVGAMTEMYTDAFKRRVLIDSDYRTAVASIIKFAEIVDLSEFEEDALIANHKTQVWRYNFIEKIDAKVALQLERAAEKAAAEAEMEAVEETETEETETEETETEETADDTLVMVNMNAITPMHDGDAVVWRLDADLNVHTTNTKEEMLRAMDELKAIIEANM